MNSVEFIMCTYRCSLLMKCFWISGEGLWCKILLQKYSQVPFLFNPLTFKEGSKATFSSSQGGWISVPWNTGGPFSLMPYFWILKTVIHNDALLTKITLFICSLGRGGGRTFRRVNSLSSTSGGCDRSFLSDYSIEAVADTHTFLLEAVTDTLPLQLEDATK